MVERVRHGGKLSDALTDTDALPSMAVRMLRLGEETGQMPMLAGRVAEFYEAKLQRSLDRVVGVVGPASIFTQTAEMHESPGSHAPPEVHAQPSAPNAQLVAVVEEQAVHKKESAAAANVATKIRLPLIVSSLAK